MKKKVLIGATLLVFVIVVISLTKEKNIPDTLLLSSEEISEKELLKNTKAIIYLSTTADQDIDNKGLSYGVFVQDDNSVQALAMKGLELGSIAVGKDQILLEDKNNINIISDNIKKFKMETPQYTGERTGYLPGKELFFSVYNSGFVEDGYSSDVRYGDTKGFNVDSIPYYIVASGTAENSVHVLTQDFETNRFSLKEITFDEELKVNDLTEVQSESTENMQVLAPILSDEDYYYLILSTIISDTNEVVSIYRINKETLEQETFELINYDNVDLTATIPYNYKNSATLHNKKLYYANGLGEIHSFDLNTTAVSKEFSLKNVSSSKVRHNEETYFKDGNLYVLRYSPNKKEQYYLESYSLEKGILTDSIDIHGLDTIIKDSQNKKVYSYDLKILK
ncbi:hypothetical protein DVB69_00700 [Sporosarcina sp. BI001-red]|uniref:hypothetical protein n=1 Tax=Sporosarcina sp. BI001-red TaxID=2282866 RepID=UPI000E283414|nr:hypothetical protein [Sporosarcina sp. BI001-red]REB11465.1 hypothetical protein DVB69_00700 [Sporosarcina sp. BI001-red]